MFWQKKCALILYMGGLYFFIALMSYQLNNSVWTYAAQEYEDPFSYINYFFYFLPTLCVHIFGLMSTWYLAGYCFFASYMFFYYPLDAFVDRLIAATLNIFFISLRASMHTIVSRAVPIDGGVLGYIWCSKLMPHIAITHLLIQLMIITCFLIMIRFSWISYVYKIADIGRIFLKKTPIIFIVKMIRGLYVFGKKFIVIVLNKVILLFNVIPSQRYTTLVENVSYNQYKKMLYDISNYFRLFFEQRNQAISMVCADSTIETNDLTADIIPKLASQTISSDSSSVYKSIPSLFFEVHGDNKLVMALQKEVDNKIVKLEEKLERFGVCGHVINKYIGPLVTVFEYEPDVDTKLSKIVMLEDDLAMVLQATSVRILAPIPGKSVVGFEVANTQRQSVSFKQLFMSAAYQEGCQILPLILGIDTAGKEIIADLTKMPHLLIAGSTGAGKSVALNSMLVSLLSKKSFHEMQLILIDPKRLEFMSYTDIPHLIFPIVTHAKKAVDVLKWLAREMDRRYEKMAEIGVRDCQEYNKKQENEKEKLSLVVVVIDEFADLMLTVKKDIEDLITRITQMARAAGIHMIIATQRPSVNVITGLIKANFTSRIALRVASKIDSRTILDTNGAERLLAKGDMLFLDGTLGQLKRIHGPFISSQEIERVVEHLRKQGTPAYHDLDVFVQNVNALHTEEDIILYEQVLSFIQHTDKISISLLQRQFKIGYNRSARIIEILEHNGLIMPADGTKVRRVIR
ncbi:MAG TPA: DNA translocase FtsK 4TM domain-containing protein [Patescibacteria group bacterium]|jgi:hypothetical protein|nr:DNA translocase FtsK 4TM domain-containing protein [Patescibacteria group bacterium]